MIETILMTIVVLAIVALIGNGVYAMFKPSSYDKELKALIAKGLTSEEAEKLLEDTAR